MHENDFWIALEADAIITTIAVRGEVG